MCQLDDKDRCEVWVETWHVARKDHRCSSCGVTIHKGTRYLRNFSVFMGEASTDKVCAPCDAIRQDFGSEHNLIPAASSLLETLDECVDQAEPGEGWKQPLKWARAARSIRQRAEASPQQSNP